MKLGYCQSCLFDKNETIGCRAMQLKWEFENMFSEMPLVGKTLIQDFSKCAWFEPIDLGEEG